MARFLIVAKKTLRLIAALWLLVLWYPFARYLGHLGERYGREWSIFDLKIIEAGIVIAFAILPILTFLQIGRRPDELDPPGEREHRLDR